MQTVSSPLSPFIVVSFEWGQFFFFDGLKARYAIFTFLITRIVFVRLNVEKETSRKEFGTHHKKKLFNMFVRQIVFPFRIHFGYIVDNCVCMKINKLNLIKIEVRWIANGIPSWAKVENENECEK